MGVGTIRNESRGHLWRSRWAAIGAALAVTLGAGGLAAVNAAGGVDSTTVLTDPVRVLDSRDPVNVGLAGPFASQVPQKLKITGSIPTTTGTKTVVPTGATGVLLNVTAVAPSAAGFISIRPGDATGLPSTSSLNFTAGQIVPNAVLVALPTSGGNAGQIDITYDAFGAAGPTTDILIDVVGYTNNSTLAALQAEIDGVEAANAAQQAQIDAMANQPIVMTYGAAGFNRFLSTTLPTTLISVGHLFGASADNGIIALPLDGPTSAGGSQYRLSAVEWCLAANTTNAGFVTAAVVYHDQPGASGSPLATAVSDPTDRTATGCYTLQVPALTPRGYTLALGLQGQTTTLTSAAVLVSNVKATWVPVTGAPLALADDQGPADLGGLTPSLEQFFGD